MHKCFYFLVQFISPAAIDRPGVLRSSVLSFFKMASPMKQREPLSSVITDISIPLLTVGQLNVNVSRYG